MKPTPSRILVRGVNWLGDAVMSTPGLMRLREANPKAHIAMLVPDKLADLWQGQSFVDEIISFSKNDGVGAVSKRLQKCRFDTALIFPNSFRSAFEPWLAGIPARVGFPGNGRAPFLTRKVTRRRTEIPMHKRSAPEIRRLIETSPHRLRQTLPSSAHHIHHYLHLAAELGANPEPILPRIEVSDAERQQFRAKFQLPQVSHPVIGINPGAEYGPAKRWPIDRFISVARQLDAQLHPVWLILGGPGDFAAASQFENGIRETNKAAACFNLAGRTTLRELCPALSLCRVVLTNDTGPMHLAAAVGTKVVVPFGSTSPELTGPGLPGVESDQLILGQAPCAPCFLRVCPIDFRCMTSITADQVARAIIASI